MMLRKFLVLNCSITGPVVMLSTNPSGKSCPSCGSNDIVFKSSNEDFTTNECKTCKSLFNVPIKKKMPGV